MRSGQSEAGEPKWEYSQGLNRIAEDQSHVGKEKGNSETYDEDWRDGIDPWEVSEYGQVPKVIDREVPQHPHSRQGMEGVQEHHPYETKNRLESRASRILNRMCAYMRRGEGIRTVDERPRFREKRGNEIYAERERDAHVWKRGLTWCAMDP